MSDKIEEIRARHALSASWSNGYSDRATLLAEVDRLRADLATQQECCDGAAAQDAHIRQEREEHRAEVAKLRAENERLTRERDKARYFLKIFIHAHASNNAVPPHIEQQARNALEGKP